MPKLKWGDRCDHCGRRIKPTDNFVILHDRTQPLDPHGHLVYPLHIHCLPQFYFDNVDDKTPLKWEPPQGATPEEGHVLHGRGGRPVSNDLDTNKLQAELRKLSGDEFNSVISPLLPTLPEYALHDLLTDLAAVVGGQLVELSNECCSRSFDPAS